jgi:hypothetical protein
LDFKNHSLAVHDRAFMHSNLYDHFSWKAGFIARKGFIARSSTTVKCSITTINCSCRAKAEATDFLCVQITSLRRIQAELVCRTTGKLLYVYRLRRSKSLRMVRLTLLTTAIRDTMPFGAIQDRLDGWLFVLTKTADIDLISDTQRGLNIQLFGFF